MSLKVVKGETNKSLDAYLDAAYTAGYAWGLFKNNVTPTEDTVIGDLTKADFSGYAGEIPFTHWNAAAFSTPRSEADASDVVWTHNGGGTSNDIYGYYVVDETGALAWAERNAAAPITISANGQTYTVKPKFTRRSEF